MFGDVLKALRRELCVTQLELANALHVNVTTVSRWELGKSVPNRPLISLLKGYAYTHGASSESIAELKNSTENMLKQKKQNSCYNLLSVEHTTLTQLIDFAPYPIYVSDFQTDELLYANLRAQEMIGMNPGKFKECKCYEHIMHRTAPCAFCHKQQLTYDKFISFEAESPFDHKRYNIEGKRIQWNGHEAQVRYVLNIVKAED